MVGSAAATVRSYCRVCTAQCGILVDVEDDRVVRIRGDKAHPASLGYTCPKGRALGQLHHHPQGIFQPLVKRDGAFVPAGWDEALDDIAGKLKAIVDEHGPASIGVFLGSGLGMDASGYRMAEAFLRGLGTPAKFSPMTIDGTAKVLVASLVGSFPGLSPRPDYAGAGLVVFIGVNPMVSHGHNIAMSNPARIIREVADRGEVWVIDPRFSDTATFATRHIGPRPGTDYAILAYLIRDVLARGAEVPAQPTTGLEELRAAVAPFDRARAARIAGVAESDLEDLRASLERVGRVAVETGTGVTMAGSANLTAWLSWVLMILTGSTNRPGGVWFHPGFLNRMDTFELPVIPDVRHPGAPSRPELPGMLGEWPCAALPDEIETGRIRAVVNFGGSLVRSFPEANRLVPALEKLDLLATFEIVENETTALSTHVLPTKGQLERPDITLWDMLSSRLSGQYTPAVLPPQRERRSAWWVIAGLMRRMGMEVPDDVPADDRDAGADDAMLARQCGGARRSFAEMAAEGFVEDPLEFPAGWVDAHIERAGGWRLAPEDLVTQLATVSEVDLADADDNRSLRLIPRRQRRHLNAQFLFLGDAADVLVNPDDAAAAGVTDGDDVRVWTSCGEITAPARIDPGMRQGVVSVPHGHAAANINVLTDSRVADPLTGMVLYGGFRVGLARA